MQRGDLVTFIAGLTTILIIALLVQGPSGLIAGTNLVPADRDESSYAADHSILATYAHQSQSAPYPIFTIQLVETPFGYPRIYIPGAEAFQRGSFQVIRRDAEEPLPLFGKAPHGSAIYEALTTVTWMPIGVLEEERGGVSTIFTIPETPIWRIHTTVTADRHPGFARMQYVLCNADTGAILDGGEIMGAGVLRSAVFESGLDVYLIISARHLDRYLMVIEVPFEYL